MQRCSDAAADLKKKPDLIIFKANWLAGRKAVVLILLIENIKNFLIVHVI